MVPSAKMAAALTPSYVLPSQPCPHHHHHPHHHHLTAGNCSGSRGSAGRGGGGAERGGLRLSLRTPAPSLSLRALGDIRPRGALTGQKVPVPPFSPSHSKTRTGKCRGGSRPDPRLLSPAWCLPCLGRRMFLGQREREDQTDRECRWGDNEGVSGSSGKGILAHFQPRICQKGRENPGPKVTKATLGSDLKHHPAAGHPSSRAKPQGSQREEKEPNFCLSDSSRCPRCPLTPRELPGTAVTPRGKGMPAPHGDRAGDKRRCQPRPLLGRTPPGHRHPARRSRDCSVTAPGTEPDPPLRTPTPAGHRGQLPSAFWEGKIPTFQSFPTLCAAGIPETHNITWRGEK